MLILKKITSKVEPESERATNTQTVDERSEDDPDHTISSNYLNQEWMSADISRDDYYRNLEVPPSTTRMGVSLPNDEGCADNEGGLVVRVISAEQ